MKKLIVFVCLFSCILACEKVENFTEENHPRFAGSYSNAIHSSDEITVASFNIEFAIHIEEAIHELKSDPALKRADILLLQEMDEVGTEQIAKELNYNYVFYPSNRNTNGQLFGLSILSKAPIVNDEKLLLPHPTPGNERRRIAITAELEFNGANVRVYNIHPSTLSVPKVDRREQFGVVTDHLNNLASSPDHVIVGGDFNTDKEIDIEYLVELYNENGLIWASENVGHTWQKLDGLLNYTLDHIFSKGFELIDAGKPDRTEASDHLPIWVSLKY